MASNGCPGSCLKAANGKEYVIKFKLLDEEAGSSGRRLVPPTEPEKIAELRKRMEHKAREALDQITERRAQPGAGGSGRLVKVGIVIARRTFVLVKYEKTALKPLDKSG